MLMSVTESLLVMRYQSLPAMKTQQMYQVTLLILKMVCDYIANYLDFDSTHCVTGVYLHSPCPLIIHYNCYNFLNSSSL